MSKGSATWRISRTAAAAPARPPCISKGFVDELKTKTIAQVIAEVDKYL